MKPTHKKPLSSSRDQKGKGLHSRNIHSGRYDFPALIRVLPVLETVVNENPYGDLSINFSDPLAVKLLNQALLAFYYQVDMWDLPVGYLCPPIPGRADYIHYIADLLAHSAGMPAAIDVNNQIPSGKRVSVLDVGMGANCIYPILGARLYGWKFVGSDVDTVAVKSANTIAELNTSLKGLVRCRLQKNPESIFEGIIKPTEMFDITICNPPFHRSLEEANKGSERKVKNLAINSAKKSAYKVDDLGASKAPKKAPLNFGGQGAELWCPGGEVAFITRMMQESTQFAEQCLWFTSLVSKQDNLVILTPLLKELGVAEYRVINMQQGSKQTRVLCWSFYDKQGQADWAAERWLGNEHP